MQKAQEPVQRFGNDGQPTVIHRQIQALGDARQYFLILRTDVQLRIKAGFRTRRNLAQADAFTHTIHAVQRCAATLNHTGVEGTLARFRYHPRADKIMLQHSDPAGFGLRGVVLLTFGDVLEVHFLEFIVFVIHHRTGVGHIELRITDL